MIWKVVTGLVFVAMIAAAGAYWFVCPCETIPGGPLAGEEVTHPVEDWSFVNDINAVPLCQIQVDFPIPRSMNVNCMSTGDDLFVSCSQCAGKQWAARLTKLGRKLSPRPDHWWSFRLSMDVY